MISVTICSPDPGLVTPWENLVSRASSNVFMNPVALKAACDTGFADIHVLLAWDETERPRRLVGLWALQARKIFPYWFTRLEGLPYNYAFLSSPVIDPGFVADVIPAFLTAIADSAALPRVVNLHSLDAQAPSYEVLLRELAVRGCETLKLSETARPVVTREFGVKKSGATRKKLRQDWNRLSALGTVGIVNERTAEATREAFETFLTLEAESWKGTQGTALLCDDADAAFVRRMIAALAEQGNASVALLQVDGRAIAAQVLMYCGTTAYTWKTAFDAEYARYSPGSLLVDKVTEELFSSPGIDAINSCAAEASFMSQLWAGRRTMVDMLVDLGPGKSLGFISEAARQLGHGHLRNLRNRLRAWVWMPQPRKVEIASPQ